jgi:hypothetical protein
VLGRAVQHLGGGIVGVRPVGLDIDSPIVVCICSSQYPKRPAAVVEAAARVLLGTAGRLHDAVEGQERVDGELPHAPAPMYSDSRTRSLMIDWYSTCVSCSVVRQRPPSCSRM